MELQFETLDYQIRAVDAVINLFKSEANHSGGLDTLGMSSQRGNLNFENAQGDFFGAGVCPNHPVPISDEQWQANLEQQQKKENIRVMTEGDTQVEHTSIEKQGKNFTVEMETGTGKTYVYLRTIFELNKQYGWTKFVIVVPSVAIREGVMHTLNTTQAHFAMHYAKPSVSYYEYKSQQLSQLKNFATSQQIEILVINIDSFAKDTNVINTLRENGMAPIRYVQAASPIVIIDEPQNMETETRRKAIESLNPLFTLRYSATHKNAYNPVYSLNPVQAYEQKLVKQIEVDSVLADNDLNGVYLSLKEIKTAKKSWSARIELLVNDKKGMKKKTITVKPNEDLFDLSNGNEQYKGFILSGMDTDQQMVSFANGMKIYQGTDYSQLKDKIQKMQIHRTIEEHLQKEKKLNQQGIKVLSLFFIDRVDNYRNDGKFAQWFEESYRSLTGEDPKGVHNGYFSQDKKGQLKDTNGATQADCDTYELIMRDKEKLLSLGNPLRFIFSHSALKEGWDNPNVFQICTLNDTTSEMKKRQEIGRGLRLPVNQEGKRMHDHPHNILTVIANESYEDFAGRLQKEIEEECGVQFAKSNIKKHEKRKKPFSYRSNFAEDKNFQAIWKKISAEVTYRVNFDSGALIETVVEKIQEMPAISSSQISHTKVALVLNDAGVSTQYRATGQEATQIKWQIPDLLQALEAKTQLTRRTIFEILKRSGKLGEVFNNPQYFIDVIAEKINESLQAIMIDGVEYKQLKSEGYVFDVIKDSEYSCYEEDPHFEVGKREKTIYEKGSCLPLDSNTEKVFANDCETGEEITFYFKLPRKFKIPTPLGNYNPDWAVVFGKDSQQVHFIAETKNTGNGSIQKGVDEAKLRPSEQLKIKYAQKYVDCLDEVNYRVVEKVQDLEVNR